MVQTSLQSEVGAERYEFPKSRESNPGQFRDSSLGVPGKSAIRMWLPQGEPFTGREATAPSVIREIEKI